MRGGKPQDTSGGFRHATKSLVSNLGCEGSPSSPGAVNRGTVGIVGLMLAAGGIGAATVTKRRREDKDSQGPTTANSHSTLAGTFGADPQPE